MTALDAAQVPADAKVETPVADAEAHHVCANCSTRLLGHFCHQCGQKAHLHDKLSHLLHEMLESIAHFDGRLWRTLPLLAFKPGELSRRWLVGKRVSYIAPLHVFMFSVFLLFLIPNLTGHHLISMDQKDLASINVATPEVRAQGDSPFVTHLQSFFDGLRAKSKDAKYYGYKIETLAYKLAFLLAPLAMILLAIVTWRPSRRSTAYKHGVVALYGLSFATLISCILLVIPKGAGEGVELLLMFALPIHAVAHLRGAYDCSWVGAIARGLLLCLLTLLSFALFVIGVAYLGLSS